MKLVIISNRLPLKISKDGNGRHSIVPSEGGLTTGLDSLKTSVGKYWVGWPGMYVENPKEKEAINQELLKHNFYPVYLSPRQIENFYEGYCNSVLWPLCHYFFSYIQYDNKYWEAYKEINALFCAEALKIIEPDDIVWIQDYQLMLLPQMLRENNLDISIGYFHHIPFPSYELFRTLSERADILNGLLGADLIGFHTHDYMRHFISAVYRVLKLDCHLDEIYLEDRVVNVDAFPMGINYDMFYNALDNPRISKKAQKFRSDFGDGKLILSVDRLDYSKGILIRLTSFMNFLENNPRYRKNVSLVMIVAPSRDHVGKYAGLKDEIDKTVGAINAKYRTMNWTPIYYFYRSYPFEDLAAFYHVSDIALVTPLRDGMNLVAKEYLAAKRDQPGVLILSEMAGAANELSDAIIVNPNNARDMENAIKQALEMPVEEQIQTMSALQEIVSVQTVSQWAKDFLDELKSVKEKNRHLQRKNIIEPDFDDIKKAYNFSRNRLLILDYDGTLVNFQDNPLKATPPAGLLDLLEKLSCDSKNRIEICSGRNKNILEKWFGHLPIGLSAEHGVYFKEDGIWHQQAPKIEWDDEILHIIMRITKRTPKSRIEIKDTAIVWHYRNVDPWLVNMRITQLIDALITPCSRSNLQIVKGNKIIEVKTSEVNKGIETERLLSEKKYDFILAMGDDTTDEDMFRALPANAYTIKIGEHYTAARYRLSEPVYVIEFLKKLLS